MTGHVKHTDEFAYKKAKDDMKVGDAKASSITYIFWKNRFSKVIIKTKDSTKLLKSCESKWGRPKEIRGYTFRWLPNNEDVEIFYILNPITEEATLIIQSDSLDRELRDSKGNTEGF